MKIHLIYTILLTALFGAYTLYRIQGEELLRQQAKETAALLETSSLHIKKINADALIFMENKLELESRFASIGNFMNRLFHWQENFNKSLHALSYTKGDYEVLAIYFGEEQKRLFRDFQQELETRPVKGVKLDNKSIDMLLSNSENLFTDSLNKHLPHSILKSVMLNKSLLVGYMNYAYIKSNISTKCLCCFCYNSFETENSRLNIFTGEKQSLSFYLFDGCSGCCNDERYNRIVLRSNSDEIKLIEEQPWRWAIYIQPKKKGKRSFEIHWEERSYRNKVLRKGTKVLEMEVF